VRFRTIVAVAIAGVVAVLGGGVYIVASGDDGARRAGSLSATEVDQAAGFLLLSGIGAEARSLGSPASASCGSVSAGFTRAAGKEGRPDAKQIGAPTYDSCELRFAFGMHQELYSWINSALAAKTGPKDLSLVLIGRDGSETARFELRGTSIASFDFPALDSEDDLQEVTMSLKLKVASARYVAGAGPAFTGFAAPGGKDAILGNRFTLTFGGQTVALARSFDGVRVTYDAATARPLIEPFEVEAFQTGGKVAPLDSFLQSFVVDGKNADAAETTAGVSILDGNGNAVATLGFAGVGMTGGELGDGSLKAGGLRSLSRRYELYAEGATLTVPR
jgi:hypothetical protein